MTPQSIEEPPRPNVAPLKFATQRVREYADSRVFENQQEPQRLRKAQGKSHCQTRVQSPGQPVSLDRRVWLTSRDAADYLGTSLGGLRNRVYRGQLKPHKPFGRLGRCYYKRMDLDRLLANA